MAAMMSRGAALAVAIGVGAAIAAGGALAHVHDKMPANANAATKAAYARHDNFERMGKAFKGLGLLDKKDMTPIRCGVASFQTRDGVMHADSIVLDTGPVLVKGKGTINLATERVDLRLRGQDKKFRMVRVLLPVTAKGPLMAPKLGVEPGAAIGQGGAALALGSLLTPLAAILPFVDPGLAKDANCGALLAEAARDGAPLKTASSKPLTAKR